MPSEAPFRVIRTFPRDLRHALRRLRSSLWYATTVVGTTALTMALATTAFTVVDGVLFKPLPYERAGELFRVSGGYSEELRAANPRGASNRSGLAMGVLDARELEAAVPGVRVALHSAASRPARFGDLRAWAPSVATVDREFLDVLGVRPAAGGFADDDFEATAEAVQAALITYPIWQARFGGRTDIIGQEVEIAGPPVRRYRIAGVLPAGFLFPSGSAQPDLLTSLLAAPEDPAVRRRAYGAIARMPTGMPQDDVQARFDAVARASREMIPDRRLNGGMGPVDVWAAEPLGDVLAARQQSTFQFVFLAAMMLVLLGCLNVSGLVASRGLERSREVSVRRALGARQTDIARLVVAELVVLLGAGTLLGLAASRPAVALAVNLLPSNLGLLRDPTMDWRVLVFAAMATAVSVVLVSLWPLRQTRRATARAILADGAQTATPVRSAGRFAIVSLQVAFGLALTLAGALVLGSLVRIWQIDVGYDTENLLVLEGTIDAADATGRQLALDSFLRAVRRVPGVASAGATAGGILRGSMPGGMWRANTYAVSEGFFDAVPLTVVDGRLPSDEDLRTGALVAVLNETMAADSFPGQRAVGQVLRELGGEQRGFTVIGVVEYARYGGWTEDAIFPQVYVPLEDPRRFSAVVRGAVAGALPLEPMLAAARQGPVELTTAATADALLGETVRTQRFQTWLFSAFAGGALAVLCVGVLGLVAITAGRRTREFAIRLALGAGRGSLVGLMLREQVPPVAFGLAAGGLLSIWVARSLRSYLHETPPFDVTIWTIAMLAIVAVTVSGILIPARRAARLDPARALRAE